MRTRGVDRSKCWNYLKKSEEFLAAAGESFERNWHNACVLYAVHAIISASDALLAFTKGLRYTGTRHDEAVELFSTIFPGKPEHEKNVSRFGTILSIKNKAEYTDALLGPKDAADAIKDATRFLEYVKGKLPR